MVAAGEFRQDLYYRINVFPIHMPSLRERLGDMALLARSMLKDPDNERDYYLTESALKLLKSHHFRGNIRELRNILARAVVLANTNVIDPCVIRQCLEVSPARPAADTDPEAGEDVSLKTMEQRYLRQLMSRHDNNKEAVAKIAGISVRSLYRKLQDLPPCRNDSDYQPGN
jgi:transcriptional regulator with PAS, ATPase and Fis domain